MKFLGYDRVFCLSPHPDDVEYAMSGTILRFSETRFDILCMTPGGKCDETTRMTDRRRECVAFWGGVGNVSLAFTEYDALDVNEDRLIHDLEKNHMQDQDAIIIPCREDNHFFDRKINSVGRALCRVNPYNLIEYNTPSVDPSWVPNAVVDIADFYAEKKRRLACFGSQQDHPYFSDFCLNAFHSNLYYNKKGLGRVEQFKTVLTIVP